LQVNYEPDLCITGIFGTAKTAHIALPGSFTNNVSDENKMENTWHDLLGHRLNSTSQYAFLAELKTQSPCSDQPVEHFFRMEHPAKQDKVTEQVRLATWSPNQPADERLVSCEKCERILEAIQQPNQYTRGGLYLWDKQGDHGVGGVGVVGGDDGGGEDDSRDDGKIV
uniref:Deacetylase sirtuin-type domain-containing protein n=1 Tax=Echinostoma caproni TaxID=27848 RepID=A0A183AY49_9TREM